MAVGSPLRVVRGPVLIAAPGQTAPASTQRATAATVAAGSGPSGGISMSASGESTCTSRLAAASPGTIAGPLSPPVISACREVNCSPDSDFSSPWHFAHLATNSGRTCCSKRSFGTSAAALLLRTTVIAASSPRTRQTTLPGMREPSCGKLHIFSPADRRHTRVYAAAALLSTFFEGS